MVRTTLTAGTAVTIDSTSDSYSLTRFLCAVLRREKVEWPPKEEPALYEELLQCAKAQGVEPLLCFFLKQTVAWASFPDQFQNSLQRGLRHQAVAEMVRTADLLNVLNKLRQADIPVLLLKGAALAYTHYPDPSLRPAGDIDIFFHYRDIGRMQRFFSNLGYQCQGPIYKSHQFTCSREAAHGIHVVYDLHWRISNHTHFARVLTHEEAVKQSMSIPALADGEGLALAPQHALLLACLHRAGNLENLGNNQDRLIWLYDIHLLLSGMSEATMMRFAHRAVTKNVQRVCLEAVCETRYRFATKVPEEIISILSSSPEKDSLKRKFRASFFGLIVDDLCCLPDTKTQFALIRELLFPPPDELLRKYGKVNAPQGRGEIRLPLLYGYYLAEGLLKRIIRPFL